MTAEDRSASFDRARELSTSPGSMAQAADLWPRVIADYREAVSRSTGAERRRDLAQLARALWRQGMALSTLGRGEAAVSHSQEAISLFTQLNDEVIAEHPDPASATRDEALGELLTALVDGSEVAFRAGDLGRRMDLLDQAVETGLRLAGPPPRAGVRTRQAMGTVYHNRAAAYLHRFGWNPLDQDAARDAALAASRAYELRLALVDPSRPISFWEMANTSNTYAQALIIIKDWTRAPQVIDGGLQLAAMLGSAGNDLAAQLQSTKAMLARVQIADDRRTAVTPPPKPRRRWWK